MTLAELYARFWTTKAQMVGNPDDLKVAKMHMTRYQDLLDPKTHYCETRNHYDFR